MERFGAVREHLCKGPLALDAVGLTAESQGAVSQGLLVELTLFGLLVDLVIEFVAVEVQTGLFGEGVSWDVGLFVTLIDSLFHFFFL